MEGACMYTDDENIQIVLSLLKEYEVKKIVVSPGMKNVPVALSVQQDKYFEVFSVVDERSAAYFASGLAVESGEPVVITCTGATASRNYLSALTEAYYRKLPVVALTCGHQHAENYTLTPQYLDRSVSQNDIKLFSAFLPIIHSDEEYKHSVFLVNKALIIALKKGGPVHINILTDDEYSFRVDNLPEIKKLEYLGFEDLLSGGIDSCSKKLTGKDIGVFIGSHNKFNDSLTAALESFADKLGAAIFCDHTSGYHGKNRIQINERLIKNISQTPDIIIDMGKVSGTYGNESLFKSAEVWRLSPDGDIVHRRLVGELTHLFNCSEYFFFNGISEKIVSGKRDASYFKTISGQVDKVIVPDLPLSNTFICQKLSELLPKDASLHLGILNSLRNMNFFNLDASIDSSSNVGGFGIDGAVSTLVGQSAVNKERIYFGLIGDLAFFYDMNALGIRHVGRNIRLIVVNNNMGVEFRLNRKIELVFGEKIEPLVAAEGHFGSAKGWVESMGFHYMSAATKDEFLFEIVDFCNADVAFFEKPVVFEVFTKASDEQQALNLLIGANLNAKEKILQTGYDMAKKVLPDGMADKIKKTIRK